MDYQRNIIRILVVIASYFIFIQSVIEAVPMPLGISRTRATHVTGKSHSGRGRAAGENGGLLNFSSWIRKYLPVIPNTYYDIPKHRYPYYDENGRGRLLYGYGGPTLYKYSVFKPLEGYF